MRLSPEDVSLFLKLYIPLSFFANQCTRLVDITTFEQFQQLPPEKRLIIRDSIFQNIELIDEFIKSNPEKFSDRELDMVLGFKNFMKGRFYLIRQLKKYAIFLTSGKEAKAYGVLALTDAFDEIAPFMPVMVDTVLLPFRDSIIYDGLMTTQNIFFGGNFKRSLNDSYNEAKAKYGIITSLSGAAESVKTPSDIDQLKYYLKSEKNQQYYWDDIQKLIRKSEQNRIAYYQEIGKYYAKYYGRKLRDLGLESGWFGILENVIVGSGKTQKDALKNIESVIPKKKIEHIYLFQLRAKK